MSKIAFLSICCFLLATIGTLKADTPANCTYEDIRGTWTLYESERGQSKNIDCSNAKIKTSTQVSLAFPNIATDENGNIGFWTIIYNQGFEVVINNRKYFAFSYYEQNGTNVTSYCGKTSFGWAHETGVNPSDWSCYLGTKATVTKSDVLGKTNRLKGKFADLYRLPKAESIINEYQQNKFYERNDKFVNAINKKQNLWKATHYSFMENMNINDLVKMAGGKKSVIIGKPKPAEVSENDKKLASLLPASFDWRNVSNVNYVSPIRNQGSCGSCFAFSSMAMNEARLRVKSLNTKQDIFSPQDIVECSAYSQGCDGGFPYLIAGKYAEDFGLVDEKCNPYKGKDNTCSTDKSCTRTYSTNYRYVGGFYGACNEAIMRIELIKNGPISVAFEVYDDFFQYKGGIYHHTGLTDEHNYKFSPFELTNHAVLVVGYGTDQATGQDFWIVKNSWGTEWGENGYFRIRRGTDECAIESIAVASDIIV